MLFTKTRFVSLGFRKTAKSPIRGHASALATYRLPGTKCGQSDSPSTRTINSSLRMSAF
ncbi:MAG: hypothetical protein HYT41_00375 [Candidatus Sungbacteria bacterium]|nr:hypothetical protein [Candidatus Sungbacteria bacterium]